MSSRGTATETLTVRGDGGADAAALLSQQDERLQHVAIGPSTVILSAYDALTLGDDAGVSADFRNSDPDARVYLFAETLVLAAPVRANGGTIGARACVPASGPAPVFDVTGAPGSTPVPQPGSAPEPGGPGGPGGAWTLYLEDVDPVVPPRVLASGGDGGAGQPGDAEKGGGDGGDGGKGGSVEALISHPALRWIEALRAAYALADPDAKRSALADLVSALPTGDETPTLVSVRATLSGAATGSASADELNQTIDAAGLSLDALAGDFRASLASEVQVEGGAAGAPGQGAPDGAPGQPGEPGTTALCVVGSINRTPAAELPVGFFVHPSQCAMTLAKAKLQFLFLDPVRHPDAVADTARLLDRVRARTERFVGLQPDDPLAERYRELEASRGAADAVQALADLHAEATRYLSLLKQGLDYFGRHGDYVPLTGLSSIARDALSPILDAFCDVDAAYRAQYAQLKKSHQELRYVRQARDQYASIAAEAHVDLPQLLSTMASSARVVDAWQVVLPRKREALDALLTRYADAIAHQTGFNMQTLLTSLGQIAFAPKSGLMYVAQAAQIGYAFNTNLNSVDGQPIRKDLVVRQVRAVEAEVDAINEGYRLLNDGTVALDDPGASKLIAVEQQLEALIGRLSDPLGDIADALLAAFQDYVSAVIERNNQVLTYNAALTLALQLVAQQQQAAATTKALDDRALDALRADLPSLTTFVSQAYYQIRGRVLEVMDLASRAYRFWALDDVDLLRDTFGGVTPPEIDATLLDQIQASFWERYAKALGEVGSGQPFPHDPTDRRGEIFLVTGAAIDALRETHQLLVRVPTATQETDRGPFLNMANVRVTQVRPYLHGASTASGVLNVTVTHTGKEDIVSPGNQVFRFQHAAIPKTFKYRIADEHILLDATFQLPVSGEQTLALVGPFTYWHLTVDPRYNAGLDLEALSAVELDFRGVSQGYL